MKYLTYAEAFRYLQTRFSDLTVGEFRAWVWGSALSPPSAENPNNHYLPAYLRADLPPSEDQQFSWMAHVDNLEALEDVVFLEEDLVRFKPVTRYLTYATLVKRWAQYQPNVEAYIAKQAHTANSFTFLALDVLDRGTDAPLKDCVFSAKLVEAWEQAKFPDAATVTLVEPPPLLEPVPSIPTPVKKKRKYLPSLSIVEDDALRACRSRLHKEPTFQQWLDELKSMARINCKQLGLPPPDEYSVIVEVTQDGEICHTDTLSEEDDVVSIKPGTVRNRFTKVKNRNPYP